MTLDSAYATIAQYRASVSSEDMEGDDAAADQRLERNLKSISRYLDWKLRQNAGFNREIAPTSREYVIADLHRFTSYGDHLVELEVEAIASQAGLVVTIDRNRDGDFTNEDPLDSAAFELFPLNADKRPIAEPWTELRLYLPYWSSAFVSYGSQPRREPRVKVDAIHGWPQVPEGITDATITLCAMFRIESTYSTMQIQQDRRKRAGVTPGASHRQGSEPAIQSSYGSGRLACLTL